MDMVQASVLYSTAQGSEGTSTRAGRVRSLYES